jgi:hypothetical protein
MIGVGSVGYDTCSTARWKVLLQNGDWKGTRDDK